jgi:hypothetical protein
VVPVAKSQHGKFYTGSTYIILNVSIAPRVLLSSFEIVQAAANYLRRLSPHVL